MKTMLKMNFRYDGLFVSSSKLKTPRQVEILGVYVPADPGMVVVLDKGKKKEVPTFTLAECPKIDWEALLSDNQKESRENSGLLFAPQGERKLIPLNELAKES